MNEPSPRESQDVAPLPDEPDEERDGYGGEWVALIVLLACWLAEASLGAG